MQNEQKRKRAKNAKKAKKDPINAKIKKNQEKKL